MTRSRGPRTRALTLSAVVALALGGCALPDHKEVGEISKPAATVPVADAALAAYAKDRAAAEQSLDVAALADIEGGALLDIDQSGFLIQEALGATSRPFEVDPAATVDASRFRSYPLWFVAVADLPQAQQQAAFVFTRASTTDPWIVRAAPRLAAETTVPNLALAEDGTAARLVGDTDPRWSDGVAVGLDRSPQQIADAYADVLTDKHSSHADEFVRDSFIQQMQEIRKAQPDAGVHFDQQWSARPVQYVLRLADGGALMFVDLKRVDNFDVRSGRALNFAGSEAEAYLPGKIKRHARLEYAHQVLMVVPAEGLPLVIGQYGGLVDASGA